MSNNSSFHTTHFWKVTLEEYQRHTNERIKTLKKLGTVYFSYTYYNDLLLTPLILDHF